MTIKLDTNCITLREGMSMKVEVMGRGKEICRIARPVEFRDVVVDPGKGKELCEKYVLASSCKPE